MFRRSILYPITALSAVALAAAVVGWPLGFWRAVGVAGFGPGGRPVVVVTAGGSVYLVASNVLMGPQSAWSADVRTCTRGAFDACRDGLIDAADVRLGDTVNTRVLRISRQTVTTVTHDFLKLSAGAGRDVLGLPGTWYAYASAPAWLVVPLLAVLPVTVGPGWRRRRRWARGGACLGCGYDLRGSPDRCPECGRVPAGVR